MAAGQEWSPCDVAQHTSNLKPQCRQQSSVVHCNAQDANYTNGLLHVCRLAEHRWVNRASYWGLYTPPCCSLHCLRPRILWNALVRLSLLLLASSGAFQVVHFVFWTPQGQCICRGRSSQWLGRFCDFQIYDLHSNLVNTK